MAVFRLVLLQLWFVLASIPGLPRLRAHVSEKLNIQKASREAFHFSRTCARKRGRPGTEARFVLLRLVTSRVGESAVCTAAFTAGMYTYTLANQISVMYIATSESAPPAPPGATPLGGGSARVRTLTERAGDGKKSSTPGILAQPRL